MKKNLAKDKLVVKDISLKSEIDSLARMIASGFEQVYKRFEIIDSRLTSMNHELKDHSVRLERIEKRQIGTLATLDETVHRSEFKTLTKRVDVLERKK